MTSAIVSTFKEKPYKAKNEWRQRGLYNVHMFSLRWAFVFGLHGRKCQPSSRVKASLDHQEKDKLNVQWGDGSAAAYRPFGCGSERNIYFFSRTHRNEKRRDCSIVKCLVGNLTLFFKCHFMYVMNAFSLPAFLIDGMDLIQSFWSSFERPLNFFNQKNESSKIFLVVWLICAQISKTSTSKFQKTFSARCCKPGLFKIWSILEAKFGSFWTWRSDRFQSYFGPDQLLVTPPSSSSHMN